VRGTLRLGVGTGFKTVTPFQGVLPALPNYGTFDKATLQKFVEEDAANFKPALADTYWTGKALGKLATLASIADTMGNSSANTKLISRIKALLEDYFTAKSDATGKLTETQGLFYYNKAWGTLIGYPASYGSDDSLNDHHFHYGYFIRSAAEVVRQDPNWGKAQNWGGMINLLIRDCANPNREDTLFPFLRNFDVYEGHTWADGKGDFGDGNNNESSSEAMNAWTGMILWGALTGDKKIRDTGIYLYVTEKEAIEHYWFDVHRLYPKEFTRPMVSMLWGGKAVYTTWFSADPIHMHGINMLPLQSGSLYLGAYPNAIEQNIKGLIRERLTHDKEHDVKSSAPRINDNWGGWGDVILMYQALSDPKTALSFSRFNTQEIEGGNSRANFYQWIHLLNAVGSVDTQVTADTPLYAVFVKDKRRTYVVYSLSPQPQTIHFSDGFTLKTQSVGTHIKTRD
jgi:endoglucanase Acf2